MTPLGLDRNCDNPVELLFNYHQIMVVSEVLSSSLRYIKALGYPRDDADIEAFEYLVDNLTSVQLILGSARMTFDKPRIFPGLYDGRDVA